MRNFFPTRLFNFGGTCEQNTKFQLIVSKIMPAREKKRDMGCTITAVFQIVGYECFPYQEVT